MTERQTKWLIREGIYVAEVDVTLVEADHEWAPYLLAQDVRKLSGVR